jgi:hypothetical protein
MSRHTTRPFGPTTVLVMAAAVYASVFWPGHAGEPSERSIPPTISYSYQATAYEAGEGFRDELLIIGDPIRLTVAGRWLEEPLVVQGAPNSTVRFQALDSGRFENGQTSLTVRSDGRGVAGARFFVARQGEYRVLASAPGSVGPAQFDIRAVTRQFRDDLASGRYARHYLATHAAAATRRQEAAALHEPQP